MYDMRPDTFRQVYQSLRRKESHNNIQMLYLVNQANHGTEKSIKDFQETVLGSWLPMLDNNGNGGLAKYKTFLQGKNLKGSKRK